MAELWLVELDAWIKGLNAGYGGFTKDKNPFDKELKGDNKYKKWNSGWDEGKTRRDKKEGLHDCV